MDRQELNRLYSNYEAAITTLRNSHPCQVPAAERYVMELHGELERLTLMTDMHQKVAAKKQQDALATVCRWKAKCQEAEAALKNLQEAKPWWKFW